LIRTEQIREIVLRMLGTGELHGYEIHRNLESRGVKIRIGRLYEILNKMCDDGLLRDSWSPSESGPQKRVYRLSQNGVATREKILLEAIRTVHEFYSEYLRALPPEKGAFTQIAGLLTRDLGNNPTIAFVSMKASKSISQLLSAISSILPHCTLYFVGPRETALEMELGKLPSLEGSYDNIPAKDNYFDLVILPGFTGCTDLDSCVSEWRRVLRAGGSAAIVTPTALIRAPEDPMSIGEFVEQRENPERSHGPGMSEALLKNRLSKRFSRVDTNTVVHIGLIIAS
jgi:DNA-binding PadR family transcriptional regulator